MFNLYCDVLLILAERKYRSKVKKHYINESKCCTDNFRGVLETHVFKFGNNCSRKNKLVEAFFDS